MKNCLYAFNGELMCFIHVLLNGIDMKERGDEVKIVIEGAAVKLVPALEEETNPFHKLYLKTKSAGIIAGVCRACSAKMSVLDEVEKSGLPLLGEMSGHPSIAAFQAQGFTVTTF